MNPPLSTPPIWRTGLPEPRSVLGRRGPLWCFCGFENGKWRAVAGAKMDAPPDEWIYANDL